jgi:hypothetical protein
MVPELTPLAFYVAQARKKAATIIFGMPPEGLFGYFQSIWIEED